MRKLKLSELVLDFDIYPRNNIDSHNVKRIESAMEAGVVLPPIIVDKKSKRIVDGFHRYRAYGRILGDDAEVDVIEKDYKNDKEMFLDTMRYNASHGAALDPCDRTRCTIIAERLHIPLDNVAGALNMPVDKLGSLKADRTATDAEGLSIPIKRTIRHFAGKALNERQEKANEALSGMEQQFYANQLIQLIEAKLIDYNDDALFDRLRHLYKLLKPLLAK